MSEEKLTFHNSKGDTLVGLLTLPDKTPSAVVILCHGSTSSKNSHSVSGLAEVLVKNGLAAFRFDFYGHGQSAGKFEDVTISEVVDDVDRAISFLKGKNFSKIALMGSSFGGSAVLFSAEHHPELFALALKSPVIDPKSFDQKIRSKEEMANWKKTGSIIYDPFDPQKTRINYSFFEDYQQYDGFKTAAKIKVPTIIIHGDSDPEVPVEDSVKASKLIPNCELHTISGADHRYTDPAHFGQMLTLLSGFLITKSPV